MNKDLKKAMNLLKQEIKYAKTSESDSLTGITARFNELETVVKNCSIPLVMPCTSFEHTAVDLKDGSTAVWTDGLSLNSDNDRHCHYRLEGGQKYKVVVYKA